MRHIAYADKDDMINRLIAEELRLANKHLPIVRASLYDLLKMEFPHVVLRDGSLHFFRKRELIELASILTEEEIRKLLLPIIIVLRPDIGEGVGVVEDDIAANALARILGIERKENEPLYLYKPYIAIIREKFDTIIQFAISVSFEVEELQSQDRLIL